MRDHGKVSFQFWTGATGRRLRGHGDAQIVALYLFSCANSTASGLFYLPEPTIAHETGLPLDRVMAALAVLEAEGVAHYDAEASLVYVTHLAKHQVGERLHPNDKRVLGMMREVMRFDDHRFVAMFWAEYVESYGLPPEAPSKPLPRPFEGPSKPLPRPFEAPSKPLPRPFEAPSKPLPGLDLNPIPDPVPEPDPDPDQRSGPCAYLDPDPDPDPDSDARAHGTRAPDQPDQPDTRAHTQPSWTARTLADAFGLRWSAALSLGLPCRITENAKLSAFASWLPPEMAADVEPTMAAALEKIRTRARDWDRDGLEKPQIALGAWLANFTSLVAERRGLKARRAGPSSAASSNPTNLCDWHVDYRHADLPAKRPKPGCPECKHVAAMKRPRGAGDPTPISEAPSVPIGWAR